MRSCFLLNLSVVVGLMLGLIVAPAAPVLAIGAQVSQPGTGRDFAPDVAEAPDGRLTAAWITDLDVASKDRDVRVATSTDGGVSWSPEVVIFDGKVGDYLEGTRIIYDGSGNLHVVFMHGLNVERKIYYRFLPAGGDPAVAGQWRDGGTLCANCINADLAVDRHGHVYVLYENGNDPVNFLGIRRRAGISGDWGPERRISTNRRVRGSLAVGPDSKLQVAFYEVHHRTAYYDRYTSYENFALESRQQISTTPALGRPDIAADASGRVHMVWDQRDAVCATSNTCPRIVWYREYANGNLTGPIQVSGATAGHRGATVGADAHGNVYVAWSISSEASLLENRRIDGAWRGASVLNEAATVARLQQYGHSHRGAVYLMFIESPTGSVATGATRFLSQSAERVPPTPPLPPTAPAPPPPTARQPDPGTTSPNWNYYPETGHFLAAGFKHFWEQQGGLAVFGFPLTTEFLEPDVDTQQVYTVQYLERQRFEYHPEHAGTPYETLLGRLGADDARQRDLLDTAPFQSLPADTPSDAACRFFPETGHRLCDGFRAYWHSQGLDLGDPDTSFRESLALFGFPISEEFTDPETGLTVQYFERARFEYHPNNPEPHRVLLARLGADLLAQRGW